MTKKIVLFNHKGGVSKTTTTFHLGWMMAEMEKKVLLVDGDPQCNLTALFLGNEGFDKYYTEESTKNNNLKDGVAVAFMGQPNRITSFDCPQNAHNENLYLLAGHMNLSEYDATLNLALTATQAIPTLTNLPGSFNELISLICDKYEIDYVFIDLNPGLSAINQVLFLIADAFIIPMNPDTFSMMALKSLSYILPNWVDWKKRNQVYFSSSAYPIPADAPRLIGLIPQRFNIRNGNATKPYQIQIANLMEIVTTVMLPRLNDAGMLFSIDEYNNAGIPNDKKLTEIKDFQGLSPKSQQNYIPVYKLSDEELMAKGAALEGMKENRDHFAKIYKDISEMILKILPC